MKHNTVFDVAVIGAGPAGCTAALRLMQLGYTVALIEKEVFPRFNIGESLSAGVSAILNYIGADSVENKFYSNKAALPSKILWETADVPLELKAKDNKHTVVNRAHFDKHVLDVCKQKGATVLQPYTAEHLKYTKAVWHITCHTVTGNSIAVQAKFIFNAMGRQGVSHKNKYYTGVPSYAKALTVAQHSSKKHTFLEAHHKFWLWGSHLEDDKMRFIFFQDPDKKTLEEDNKILLKHSYFGNAFCEAPIHLKKSFLTQPFWNTEAVSSTCFCIGEAAFALDPLSSSGVEKAMRYALQAVIAFNTMKKKNNPTLAQQYLKEKLLSTIANHTVMNLHFYNTAFVKSEHSFWNKRRHLYIDERWIGTAEARLYNTHLDKVQQKQNKSPQDHFSHIYKQDKDVLRKPFKIGNTIRYVKTPCVVENCVDERLALHIKESQWEIAFIEGVEIVPLLQLLPKQFYLNEIATYWTAKLTLKQTLSVLPKLLEQHVLVPV